MKNINEIIQFLKNRFKEPINTSYNGLVVTFSSNFENPAVQLDFNYPIKVPEEVLEFWTYAKSGDLFKDITYGQWGLHIFSLEDALARTLKERENRPADFDCYDIIIGSFYGDLDLLVIDCSSGSDSYGKVLVALPLDKRADWPVVANNFTEFLNVYVEKEGGKFWAE